MLKILAIITFLVSANMADCPPGYTPIYDIQGSGETTPLEGQTVTTCGVVTGLSNSLRGAFIQDTMGDGITNTSDGLFVYRYYGISAEVGDLIAVTGRVSEYYGMTEISSYGVTVLEHAVPIPTPSPLTLPMTRTLTDTYLEQREGMLVQIPTTATVIGPPNYYGETYIVRGDTGIDRIVLQDNKYQDGYRIGIDDGLAPAPELKTGDIISGVHGPLHFTFDNWKIEQDVPLGIVEQRPVQSLPQYNLEPGQFSIGAFNVLNLDSDDTATKLLKVVDHIAAMGGPTFLALSEVATDECPTDVVPELRAFLALRGYNDYWYSASHPDVGCHGITLLWRENTVTVDGVTTLQSCSPVGSSSSTYDALWSECQASGEYPLFSRRPVVVTGTITYDEIDTQVVAIAVHLKAKTGSSTCNDSECSDRRLEQAEHIVAYVSSLQIDNVAVIGDFNDYIDSPPLQALYSTGLTDTFFLLPPSERHSYIYEGKSQALDHILLSPTIFDTLSEFAPLHINADFPNGWENAGDVAQRASDHDPLVAFFDLPTRPRLYLPIVLKRMELGE